MPNRRAAIPKKEKTRRKIGFNKQTAKPPPYPSHQGLLGRRQLCCEEIGQTRCAWRCRPFEHVGFLKLTKVRETSVHQLHESSMFRETKLLEHFE